jgi:hypothetical protein
LAMISCMTWRSVKVWRKRTYSVCWRLICKGACSVNDDTITAGLLHLLLYQRITRGPSAMPNSAVKPMVVVPL